MGNALNCQYVQRIRSLINDMEAKEYELNPSNPLPDYIKSVENTSLSFNFNSVSMKQLRNALKGMKPTRSMGEDDISMKIIKSAQAELEPLLLHLVNATIRTSRYPTQLKTTMIVPIEKANKDRTSAEGWRPVNVVPALTKVIEHILLHQIMDHLNRHNLIKHGHHGAIMGKSTQSLVAEVHDRLIENMTQGTESALIILDQSKAYNVVSHKILIQKLELLGFRSQAKDLMGNFLSKRKQYIQIDGQKSDKLLTGPQLVIQGSTLSCVLFLIYILDMPDLFHAKPHRLANQRRCKQPS